jgi:CheY-like chemotaxis protein
MTSSLDTIVKSVHRGAGLVRQILTFARKTEPALEPININKALRDLTEMLVETFPRTISIRLETDEKIPVTSMDHTQFNQMILNLCINARDAMMDHGGSEGGTITIKTTSAKGKDVQEIFPEAKPTTYLLISIGDTGVGMDSTTRAKIFDPFFTTKEPGKGTGLGLAVVYGIVNSHGGLIDCTSAPGHGTVFTVYLPVALISPRPTGLTPEEEQAVPGGSETLLIVEDEENLRNVTQMVLEGKGYTVLAAADGVEAIQLYASHYGKIALVITDLGLPRLDGISLFSAIKEMNPKQKIALASGNLPANQKSELLKSGAIDFFQKPFVMVNLLVNIRKILDQ